MFLFIYKTVYNLLTFAVDTAPLKKRPMSAPVARTTNRPPDIWDNVSEDISQYSY